MNKGGLSDTPRARSRRLIFVNTETNLPKISTPFEGLILHILLQSFLDLHNSTKHLLLHLPFICLFVSSLPILLSTSTCSKPLV